MTVIDEQEEKHRTCVCFEENEWEKTDTSTCLQCAQFVDVCGVLGRDPSKVSYLTNLSPSVLLPSSWVSPLLGYSASSKAPEALKIYPEDPVDLDKCPSSNSCLVRFPIWRKQLIWKRMEVAGKFQGHGDMERSFFNRIEIPRNPRGRTGAVEEMPRTIFPRGSFDHWSNFFPGVGKNPLRLPHHASTAWHRCRGSHVVYIGSVARTSKCSTSC